MTQDADRAVSFKSLEEMQARHAALVREIGSSVVDRGRGVRIAEFILRARASGAFLDAKEDRGAAQGLINFWTSRLTAGLAAAEAQAQTKAQTQGPSVVQGPTEADSIASLIPDDTLLEEFDPSAIASAQEEADRWLTSLPSEDQESCRRILLRLVRLSERGDQVLALPTTRASIHDIFGLSAAKADELLLGLARAGVVRVTRGDTPSADQIALRSESLIETWGTLQRYLAERRRYRDVAARWSQSWLPADLAQGPELDELRGFHDRNEEERRFVEASRREEWRETQKNQTLVYVALPLLVVAVLGLIATGMSYFAARDSAIRATDSAKKAVESAQQAKDAADKAVTEAENAENAMHFAQEQYQWANYEAIRAKTAKDEAKAAEAEAKNSLVALKERQKLSEMAALVRTLAIIGNGGAAEREIAFHRLDALERALSRSENVKAFFTKNRDQLGRIRESPESVQVAQTAALDLARGVKQEILTTTAAMSNAQEIYQSLEAERAVIFDTAAFCADRLVATYSSKTYQDADGYRREFWILYWGEMGLVEGDKVKKAMVDFGRILQEIDDDIAAKLKEGRALDPSKFGGLNVRQAIQQAAIHADRSETVKDAALVFSAKVREEDVRRLKAQLSLLKRAMGEESLQPVGFIPLKTY